jgi:hypothetical protein
MARAVSTGIATGASLTEDVALGGVEWLTVIGVVGNAASAAGASGDVGITVQPYLEDAVGTATPTLADVLVPATDTGVAVLANSRAQQIVRFRVAGIRKVRIFVKNNNAATKPVEADYHLG